MVVGGGFVDQIGVGVLASSVPREAIDDAVAACGKQARRSDGKLPPHVMVYFAMAMALFADEDYEEVLVRLVEPLRRWGCWDAAWPVPGSSGITQARQRLGSEVLAKVFERVAVPVGETLTRGARLCGLRLVSMDGMVFDVPDTPANAEAFGYPAGAKSGVFPQARAVTLVETGSRASIGAQIGPCSGKGTGERSLAARLLARMDRSMLMTADRGFYSYALWCAGADSGAQLLWRIGDTLDLPAVTMLPDGSYTSVVFDPRIKPPARARILDAARDGEDLADVDGARLVRVIEYTVPDRGPDGPKELICLLTTILDARQGPAAILAEGYHQRWEHESGNDEIKTVLRGSGRVLRSHHPDMVHQEIYGYLLAHYTIRALICRAATEADIDPDRVPFTRAMRIVRRRIDDPAAFSP
jgi:transposase IS4-like protein/DDE family transposase